MERIGILVVSYGAREAAMIDVFTRSRDYETEIYVIDKQKNPFNMKRAVEHTVVPDLGVDDICRFGARRRKKIDFCIVGPEKPIINGVRDALEREAGIPVICPTKEFAIEASKVAQRRLFEKAVPSVNPRFRIFDPGDYRGPDDVRKPLYRWLDELGDQAVVKPDVPAAGKGVGVWGDDFTTREQLFSHFMANYEQGSVVVEEKLEGEESSFQAFCDGKRLIALPETRDYKRAFDDDQGPNTGGMGSYKSRSCRLPFMSPEDERKEGEIVGRVFEALKRVGAGDELRGVPFYVAFIHTSEGPKILENNSRPGDPEMMNILPLLKEDFVDICFKMIEGNLTKVTFENKASVVTYKAPPSYGGYQDTFPQKVRRGDVGSPIRLEEAMMLGDNVRVYPASADLRDGQTYALSSRTVAVVGIANTIQDARDLSLKGMAAIEGGALWNRTDVASSGHIQKSVEHMVKLRHEKK
jgi:phosphoribosylamine--glycine ligase